MNTKKQDDPIFCHTIDDIPKEQHWAIVETERYMEPGYHEGDKHESREKLSYRAYLDKALWEADIIKRTKESMEPKYGSPTPFRAFEVKPVSIETQVSVKVG